LQSDIIFPVYIYTIISMKGKGEGGEEREGVHCSSAQLDHQLWLVQPQLVVD
jgi:hypothetical protein